MLQANLKVLEMQVNGIAIIVLHLASYCQDFPFVYYLKFS